MHAIDKTVKNDNIALTELNGIDIIIYHTVVRYADFEIN